MTAEIGIKKVAAFLGEERPRLFVSVGCGNGRELHVVRRIWPNCRIVAVDPLPEHCRLVAPVAHRVVQRAAWSERARLRLYCGDGPSHRTSAFRQIMQARREVVVRCKADRLDRILAGEDVRDAFLWIDTEGAELEVLAGAKRTLAWTRWLNIELALMRLRDGPDWYEVDGKVRSAGFRSAMIHSVARNGSFADMLYLRHGDWMLRRARLARRSRLRMLWRRRKRKRRHAL